MLPPFVPENTSSQAERKIFKLLSDDLSTSDWTVLHSLALSQDKSKRPYGEIDFVILLPGFGVVCLEVKGGGIRTNEGIWFTTGADGVEKQLKRSPFVQARESMFMLRKRLEEYEGKQSLPFQTCYIVVFSDCLCPPINAEFTRSEVIDASDLRVGIGNAITRCVKQRTLPGFSAPPKVELNRVRALLRPDFDRGILFTTVLRDAEERIARFTDEQLSRLEELEENQRCLFDGPAGTGKTALALHFARRLAAEGKSTLLLCFNRMLGKWMTAHTEDTEFLKAGSFWSVMSQLVYRSEFRKEFEEKSKGLDDRQVFELLGEYTRLALLEFSLKFDVIVVDEAQDLAREPFISLLDDLLEKGLAQGSWAMFGDFSQQVLFGDEGGIDCIRAVCSNFTYSKLRRNCRNTKQIAATALDFAELPATLYKGELLEGPEVDVRYYKSMADQVQEVERIVEKLFKNGVLASDLIILSPNKLQNSCLADVMALAGCHIVDITNADDPLKSGQFIRFSTVAAYKGLESSVAIIIDVQQVAQENPDALLYVALTRPRSCLIVLCHERSRDVINKRITQKQRTSF